MNDHRAEIQRVEHAEKMRDLTLAENSRLKEELDREREARQGIETLYREMCLRLRATCERYKLGLGGEQLDVLVSEALDTARAALDQVVAALAEVECAWCDEEHAPDCPGERTRKALEAR